MEIGENIDRFADVGWTGDDSDQGRDCLAYSENEDRVHELFREEGQRLSSFAEKHGLRISVEEDPFGNSYIKLHGQSDRNVMICSHLDSVFRGGRYDGIMGVSAGLGVIEKLVEQGEVLKKSILVAAFRAEESSATGKACLGSSLATGDFDVEGLKDIRHSVLNKNTYDLLLDRGLTGEALECLQKKPYIDGQKLDAVIEFHSEQSSVLDSMEKPFGLVVHGIGGARRSDVVVGNSRGFEDLPEGTKILRFRVSGRADHSGGTPMNGEIIGDEKMDLRNDALVMAMNILEKVGVEKLVNISVPAGGYNTIPGECVLDISVFPGEEISLEGISCDYELVDPDAVRIGSIQNGVAEAAMNVVRGVEGIGMDMSISTKGKVRATVGDIYLNKNGNLVLKVDQRFLDNEWGKKMAMRIFSEMKGIEEGTGVEIKEENVKTSLATPFVGGIQFIMRRIYEEIYGELPVEMGSMPGHDASKVIRSRYDFVSGGMVFVRSRNGGISHHPNEFCSEEDVDKASDFLFKVVEKLVY